MVHPGKGFSLFGLMAVMAVMGMAAERPRPIQTRGHRRALAKPSSNRKAALLEKALKRQERGR